MESMIALYIRLSLEDIDLDGYKTESTSIRNQRLHLWDFLTRNPDVKNGEVREFVDDGYSGTNFSRPAFNDMLNLVRCGQVRCIIVKDFSRLGRNYLEVGNYLEQIFPILNVRFISIDDHYDSKSNKGNIPGPDVVFKNIIHDHYSKELSGKVIQTKRSLAHKGLFLGGIPPFGYIRNPDNKYQLIIDPKSAEIVRRIFAMTLGGKKKSEIVRILNAEKIESPSGRLRRLGIRKSGKDGTQAGTLLWSSDAISRILNNPVVTGSITNHRVERKQMGKSGLRHVKKEEHIIVEHMHEAIIDPKVYQKIQSLKEDGNRNGRIRKKNTKIHPLNGTIKCGYCGKNLGLEGKKKKTYICRAARRINNQDHEETKIKEDDLLDGIANILYVAVKLQRDNSSKIEGEVRKRGFLELYEEYVDGSISKEEFLKKKQMFQGRAMTNSKKEGCILPDNPSWITKDVIQSFLKEIQIFPNKKINIVWKCEDWFQKN